MSKPCGTDDASLSIEWIEKHGAPYKSSWVAVQAGKLVGVARTRKALLLCLRGRDRSKLLITRVD